MQPLIKELTDGYGGDPGGGYEYVGPGVVVPVHRILDGRRHRVIPEMEIADGVGNG